MPFRLRSVSQVRTTVPGGHVELIDRLLDPGTGLPGSPDLVLLAYAGPDPNGYVTSASYLNERTGGRAHSFAVPGEGAATIPTAIGIARAYQNTGRSRSSLVMAAQAATPARPGSAVLLALDSGPGPGTLEMVEPAGDPVAVVERALPSRPAGARALVLTAEPIAAQDSGRIVVRHPQERAGYGGAWLEIGRHWSRWQREYALVAVPEPALGGLVLLHGTA